MDAWYGNDYLNNEMMISYKGVELDSFLKLKDLV
jgi:hypothetical protein